MVLLPLYVWFTAREIKAAGEQARHSAQLVQEAANDLRVTQANRETAEKELEETRAELRKIIAKKLDAEKQLTVAQDKFERFKAGTLSKASFLRDGLGITTPAARSKDVAADLRNLRGQQKWEEATARATAWLGFHKSFPSDADKSALLEVALLWKRLADPRVKLWKAAPFKSPYEALSGANEILEEAEGKVMDAQPSPSTAGNWGTLLRDLANLSRDATQASKYRQNAVRLLDIAVKGAPGDDAWLRNRVYLEQDLRKRDPSGFAAYCEGIRPFARVAKACGKVLFASINRGQVAMPDAERTRLVCKAAAWTGRDPSVQAECERAKRNLRHP
jgi:hypothetical protein